MDDVDAIADPQAAQARLGVLPDGFGLYPRLTAREHIEYFGELHGISGARLRAAHEELLDLLDMNAIADRRTGGFSHGERTKVASPARSCTARRTCCSTSRPTGSTS